MAQLLLLEEVRMHVFMEHSDEVTSSQIRTHE